MQLKQQNIILVGPMGVGKTSIGKLLAQQLERKFYDVDAEIEQKTGIDIPSIFDREGEAGFRAHEQAMLQTLLKQTSLVIATGGGAVTQASVRALLRANGYIIYLAATPEQLLQRIKQSIHRPKLAQRDKLQVLHKLHQAREQYYKSLADMTIPTDGVPIHKLVKDITGTLSCAN